MAKPGYMSPEDKKKYDERKALQQKTLESDKKTLEEKGSWVRQLGKKIMGDSKSSSGGQSSRGKTDKTTKSDVKATSTPTKSSSTPPKPTSRPSRAPKLEGNRKVGAAPKPRSAREGKEMQSRAWEKRVGTSNPVDSKSFPAGKPDNSRTSGNRDVKGSLGYRIAKMLGDNRSEAQMIKDRKMTEKMNKEMGR